MTAEDIPDDLAGLDEPTRIRFVGEVSPAALAHYDQVLHHLNQVSHRLFFIHMTALDLDPDNEAGAEHIQALAREASQLVWELPEEHKALLINILTGHLVNSANAAIAQGWLPSTKALDDPIIRDEIAATTGIPLNRLDEIVARLKARAPRYEGGADPQQPATDPPSS